MKVALYVRVSTNTQEAENQLQDLREFCRRSDYEIFKEYVDVMSGAEDKRPAFQSLFFDAQQETL